MAHPADRTKKGVQKRDSRRKREGERECIDRSDRHDDAARKLAKYGEPENDTAVAEPIRMDSPEKESVIPFSIRNLAILNSSAVDFDVRDAGDG